VDARDVTLAFRAYGLNIGLVLCDPVRPDDMSAVLPHGHQPIAGGRLDRVFRLERLTSGESPVKAAGYHWYDNGEYRRFARTPETAVEYAEAMIEHHIAEFSPDYIFIHAGVVIWQSAAVILPGESQSGKSTLVRALVNAGATYFTDEYAVLDADGTVYPYLRHLSQRDGPFGPAGRVDLAAHAPSSEVAQAGARVVLVVLTRFEAGAAWRVEQLGPGAAMMAMSQHVIAIRRRPADAFAVMSRVVEGAAVVEGVRGDATEAATRILAALDGTQADEPVAIARDLTAQRG
jgi:hypothetical protein